MTQHRVRNMTDAPRHGAEIAVNNLEENEKKKFKEMVGSRKVTRRRITKEITKIDVELKKDDACNLQSIKVMLDCLKNLKQKLEEETNVLCRLVSTDDLAVEDVREEDDQYIDEIQRVQGAGMDMTQAAGAVGAAGPDMVNKGDLEHLAGIIAQRIDDATKDLREEITGTRAKLVTTMKECEARMKEQIQDTETRMNDMIESKISALEKRLERVEKQEKQDPLNLRIDAIEAAVGVRIDTIEVSALQREQDVVGVMTKLIDTRVKESEEKMNEKITTMEQRLDTHIQDLNEKMSTLDTFLSDQGKKMNLLEVDLTQKTMEINALKSLDSHQSSTSFSSVHAEVEEIEKKKCNMIIFGLGECSFEDKNARKKDEKEKVDQLLQEIDFSDRADIQTTFRVGSKSTGKTRPLVVRFDCPEIRNAILKKAWNLKGKDKYHNVFLAEDLTRAQYASDKEKERQLKEEANKRNAELPEGSKKDIGWRVIGGHGNRCLAQRPLKKT